MHDSRTSNEKKKLNEGRQKNYREQHILCDNDNEENVRLLVSEK